jgi:hypothetical protein
MEQLQYDPRTKQLIKDTLYDFLYTPVVNQFQRRLDVLIVKNTLLGGYSHKSFNYKGVLYSCDSGSPPRKWNRLLSQLKPQMDEYLQDLNQLNEHELPFVIGFINQVLNASNDIQDYLKLFPESLHQPLNSLIASCPCGREQLTTDKVAELLSKNSEPINMMKARMVKNLLI